MGWRVVEGDFAALILLPEVMVADVNMLSAVMEFQVFGDGDC